MNHALLVEIVHCGRLGREETRRISGVSIGGGGGEEGIRSERKRGRRRGEGEEKE